MHVSEDDWFRAFVVTYVRKYMTYREAGFSPFVNLAVSNILTETYWIGRTRYKLAELPSGEIRAATRMILNGLSGLRVPSEEEQKLNLLAELCGVIQADGGPGSLLAAGRLRDCLHLNG